MVVGYQNLLTLVSLKLVYNPPLLNLTGSKKKKKNILSLLFHLKITVSTSQQTWIEFILF